MAGNEDPMKNFRAVGHGSTAAEMVEVVEELKVEEEVPAAKKKRKADDSQVAAAAGASSDEKAEAATGSGEAKAPEIKWVELPLEYIAWLLAQKGEEGPLGEIMATDEVWKEDFFAFQEWVRETFEQNGRVMVPEDSYCNQDMIDEAWEEGLRQLEMTGDACPSFINMARPPPSN